MKQLLIRIFFAVLAFPLVVLFIKIVFCVFFALVGGEKFDLKTMVWFAVEGPNEFAVMAGVALYVTVWVVGRQLRYRRAIFKAAQRINGG